jgi:Recombination endonuclease VII
MPTQSNYERFVKPWRARHAAAGTLRTKRAEEARNWRAAHPDLSKEIKARHRMLHLVEIRKADAARQKKRRKADPERQRQLVAKYKQRLEEKREEIAGRPRATQCDICALPGKTVFDHDHETGAFRGWICDRCNKVLGLVYDNPELLCRLAYYLDCREAPVSIEIGGK